HAGIDLVKHHLAPIEAFTEGEVIFAGLGKTGTGLGNYGNVVLIKDKNSCGQLYAHLDSVKVKTGDEVKKGQVIGTQGATGRVTGSHLHYEVRKKTAPSYGWTSNKKESTINPVNYLKDYYKEEKKDTPKLGSTFHIKKDTDGYYTAADAKAGKNKRTLVKAGVYFVFDTANGMINVTTKNGTPGSWINPGAVPVANKPAPKTFKVGQKVKVNKTAKKYANVNKVIPDWVKGKSYTIMQVNNDRVLLKEIMSWVKNVDVE